VHLVGAGELGEHLRQLLRGGVNGWRLHELPATQTPLTDAEPLLGPRVSAMLAGPGSAHSRRSPPSPTWGSQHPPLRAEDPTGR
jgi:hypothetical protein